MSAHHWASRPGATRDESVFPDISVVLDMSIILTLTATHSHHGCGKPHQERPTWRVVLAPVFLALLLAAPFGHAAPPLRFGILPSLTSATVMHDYQPLNSYLEKTLGRNIHISTAPSFREHIRRAGANEYDFILTGSHVAKFLEDESRFIRLARMETPLRAVLLVPAKVSYKTISEIKGKTIAIRDSLAMATMLGEALLAKHDLHPGRNINFIPSPSHISAALSVINEDAEAAIISERAYEMLAAQDKKQLRVLAYSGSAPNIMFMASPQMDKETVARLRDALLKINPQGINSQLFFDAILSSGVTPITEQEMRFASPFAALLKKRLAQVKP